MADLNEEFNKVMDTPDTTGEYDTQDINDNKVWAILACFGVLFWLPLVAAPNSRFARFYANQGLILLITGIVVGVASQILGIIPVVGNIIGWILRLCIFVLAIFAIINAAQGKAKEVPIVGGLLKVIK